MNLLPKHMSQNWVLQATDCSKSTGKGLHPPEHRAGLLIRHQHPMPLGLHGVLDFSDHIIILYSDISKAGRFRGIIKPFDVISLGLQTLRKRACNMSGQSQTSRRPVHLQKDRVENSMFMYCLGSCLW